MTIAVDLGRKATKQTKQNLTPSLRLMSTVEFHRQYHKYDIMGGHIWCHIKAQKPVTLENCVYLNFKEMSMTFISFGEAKKYISSVNLRLIRFTP